MIDRTVPPQRRSRGRRTHRGFSLLELLIASVILGIGLIMVATMFPVAMNQHRLSAQQIMATQAALGAKRLVKSHLVPHIDPLRRYRSPNTWPLNELGPDLRDLDGNGIASVIEATARGPIRWDPPMGGSFAGASRWHLMHFETILTGERIGVEPAGRIHEPTLSYADEMNGAQSEIGRQRPAWFRVGDTVSPPIRFPSGGPQPGVMVDMADPSFAWYVFYQRPSPDPTSTDLAYYVAVCRVGGGAEFLFQDLRRQSTGRRGAARADPQPASTSLRSRLPIPWLVNVRGGPPELLGVGPAVGGADGSMRRASAGVSAQVAIPSQNLFREADRNGDVKRWQNGDEPRLFQLAPRGARLLGQVTGTVYTVVASPGRGDLEGTSIDVLPQPSSFDTAVWIFPPPVVMVGGQPVWQSQSPFITGLQF